MKRTRLAALVPPQTAPDPAALARLYAVSPYYNAAVRTTCVATMVDAGHATNALPQRAKATVNCCIQKIAQSSANRDIETAKSRFAQLMRGEK